MGKTYEQQCEESMALEDERFPATPACAAEAEAR